MKKSYRDYASIKTTKIINSLPTPFIVLNTLLNGGTGEGRWLEIVGAEGLGKTTLTLQIAGNNLYDDKELYLYIADAEMTLLTDESKNRVVNLLPFHYVNENYNIEIDENIIKINDEERIVIIPVQTYQEMYEEINNFAKFLIDNKLKGLIIWDSLVQLTTEESLKGSKQLGMKAKYIQEIINDYNKTFYTIPITLYVINQIRAKIVSNIFMGKDKSEGDMSDVDFSIAGGYAHRFYAFQTLVLVKGKQYKYPKSSDEPLINGKIVEMHVKKNKLGKSGIFGEMVFIPEIGYSDILSILNYFEKDGLIKSANFIKISQITDNKSYKLIPFLELLLSSDDMLEKFVEFSYLYMLNRFKNMDKGFNKETIEYYKERLLIDIRKLMKYINERQESIVMFDIEEENE